MAVLFLKVAMIRDRRAWVVVRAAKLSTRVRRPLALMRMVVVRPSAAAVKGYLVNQPTKLGFPG